MILDAYSRDSRLYGASVFDGETGERIRFCYYADDTPGAGRAEYFAHDERGLVVYQGAPVKLIWPSSNIRIELACDEPHYVVKGGED